MRFMSQSSFRMAQSSKACVPTPTKATRIRESTVAALLKRYRIRRLSAAQVIETLRAPAIPVAPGTERAATGHLDAVACTMVRNQTCFDASIAAAKTVAL
jgi:hypothetical protein